MIPSERRAEELSTLEFRVSTSHITSPVNRTFPSSSGYGSVYRILRVRALFLFCLTFSSRIPESGPDVSCEKDVVIEECYDCPLRSIDILNPALDVKHPARMSVLTSLTSISSDSDTPSGTYVRYTCCMCRDRCYSRFGIFPICPTSLRSSLYHL
jgi:hypothetical protein